MTWRSMAEVVMRIVSGGDISDDNPLDPREIYLWIAAAIPALNYEYAHERRAVEPAWNSFDASQYMTLHNLKVKKDEYRDRHYISLPVKPMILYGAGTPQVVYSKDEAMTFTYREANLNAVVAATGNDKYNPNIPYWLESVGDDDRLYFTRDIGECCDVEHLVVRLIPGSFSEVPGNGVSEECIDQDSAIPVHPSKLGKLQTQVLQLAGALDKEPEDIVNDGVNG